MGYSLLNRQLTTSYSNGSVEHRQLDQGFFKHIAEFMRYHVLDHNHIQPPHLWSDEPPFLGGLVGYFGYEMKAESMDCNDTHHGFQTVSSHPQPDSAFLYADRVVILDHLENNMYLSVLYESESDLFTQLEWMESVSNILSASTVSGDDKQEQSIDKQDQEKLNPTKDNQAVQSIDKQDQLRQTSTKENQAVKSIDNQDQEKLNTTKDNQVEDKQDQEDHTSKRDAKELELAHTEQVYLDNIATCLDQIHQGETYEVCLTTQLSAPLSQEYTHPLHFYLDLRKRNPAPYSAFLNLPNIMVASSSPERFIRIEKSGLITMKPIKGTLQRATLDNFHGTLAECEAENQKRVRQLESSEKDRAENLMIVDLIRNDLNLISEPLSVHVPALMKVETYATVHQLVTTVSSRLRSDLTPVDAVKECFPPGSMTGAPKLRTVRIIEELEHIPRGVYSGCLGFFSVTGSSDFNVVIRTCVFTKTQQGTRVSVGAGGAIVALSDPAGEFDEMLLKANSVLPSLAAIYNIQPRRS